MMLDHLTVIAPTLAEGEHTRNLECMIMSFIQ
jgi:hypothetical protein